MNPKITEIDPAKYYSASYIVKRGWTFWSMVISFTSFLRTDEGKRLYRPIQFTQGSVQRYKILGSSIIEVLESADRGDLKITHDT